MTLKKVIALTATLTLTLGMCAVPVLAEDAETEFNEIIGADTEAEADRCRRGYACGCRLY